MSIAIGKKHFNNNKKASVTNRSVLLTKDYEDKHLSVIISLVMFSMFMLTILARFSEGFGFNSSLLSIVSDILKLMLGVVFLSGIKIILKRLNLRVIMFIILSTIVVFLNFLFFPDNNKYFISFVVYFYVTILPLYVYISLINDYSYLLDSMTKMSFLISVIAIVVFVLSHVAFGISFNYRSYSMSFSYGILLPSMVLVRNFITTRNLWSLFLAVGLITLIIVYGSRGPVICLVTYFFIKLSRKYTYYERGKYKLILLIVVSIGLYTMLPFLLQSLSSILDSLDISSRVVNLFLEDSVDMSGRDFIYKSIYSSFLESPFTVRGINADFLLVGTYAHNLFLELFYQMGFVLGFFIITLIFLLSMRTLFNKNFTPHSDCSILFFSVALPQLMISGSLWSSMYFWMWVALMLKKNVKQQSV